VRGVQAIADYISFDSPAYARAVVKRIVSLTRTLSTFPNSGGMVPEFQDPGIRELIVYSYRVIYIVGAEEVLIAAVIHGKRDLS
jgi:toxin ParE1/3/4